ncbi:peptidase [Arsenicicoccus sp. MKL-02]|uniref:Peptidase n=1 Tax=Arsenicicoccus cauae TaxID=2663847 RepID=A0A6I3IW38_9MICO|nr:peptidase [Arsenicicoccus cauae]MTB72689.1 peptidase [Arsenicicoccus cauae]
MPYAATVDHPGGTARFDVTRDALEMVASLGGHLHAYVGGEGCRAQSLAFTTREPRRALECRVDVPETADDVDWEGTDWTEERLAALAERIPLRDCRITVSAELAPLVDGGELDFGDYLRMERFVWARLAGEATREGRRCTCLRSVGVPRGKRATCLDDARQGLT